MGTRDDTQSFALLLTSHLVSSSSNHVRPCANVAVTEVGAVTECARRFGASVLLERGPPGWRRVAVAPAGGEIAFRQPK